MAIELPKDAEGREIPLDTKTLYTADGTQRDVSHFTYYPKCKITEQSWHIVFTSGSIKRASRMYLTPPDSWEKLEEDIRRIGTDDCTWFCGYANENPVENACPDSCKFFKGDEITCRKKLADDILSRIRKLRGEDE